MRLPAPEPLRGNAGTVLLFVVLTTSLGLNVFLGWKIRETVSRDQSPKRVGVQQGMNFPLLPVLDENGKRTFVSFDKQEPSVVYVLSPTCFWCKRNQPNITVLASAKSAHFRFIGIAVGGNAVKLKEYLRTYPLPFRVYSLDSRSVIKDLGLDVTPQTVVVSSSGRVEKVWVGAFEGRSQKEAEQFFDVTLPGQQNAEAMR